MVDKKITELDLASSVAGTDLVPVVVNPSTLPETKKVTISTLMSGVDLSVNTVWATKGDLLAAIGNDAASTLSAGSNSQKLISDSSASTGLKWIDDDFGLNVILGDGVNVISTGVKGFVEMPFDGAIESVRLFADVSGSIVIDVWKDSYANFPPTVIDTVTASAKPTLSTTQKFEDSALTGWTKTFTKGDILAVNVDSAVTVKQVTLSISGKKTATV